jgi:hypothetical protein
LRWFPFQKPSCLVAAEYQARHHHDAARYSTEAGPNAAVDRQDANPLAGALRCLSEISTNLNESNICDESDILNHTGVDAPAMLVWGPDTKVQCSGARRLPAADHDDNSAKCGAAPCRIILQSDLERTESSINPCACKFPIAEARWLLYRRLCS